MQNIIVRPTQPNDLTQVMPLFEHSRSIMRQNGNHSQWVNGYPSMELIASDIEQQHSFVACRGEQVIAVFAFIPGRDPTYDHIENGSWEDDLHPYSTIHRLASAPGQHGIFKACIDWCRTQATSLRIDTHADNSIMLHLLQKHGFQHRGVIYIADGTPREAFQMLNTRRLCLPMVDYIEREILPRYEAFDPAHQRSHAEAVIRASLNLANHYDTDINMVYAIAAYHDLGLSQGRENHHTISADILLGDSNLHRWFSPSQLVTMAEAAEDHRASSKQPPRSIYGKIVAEADRDIEPYKIIRRTIQFGLANYPELSREEHWCQALSHLNEKYGTGGYLRLFLPESPNAAKLEELRTIIADQGRLRDIFDVFFKSETI